MRRSLSAARKGTRVFTIAKGGLMYDASIAAQKFSCTARQTGSCAGIREPDERTDLTSYRRL